MDESPKNRREGEFYTLYVTNLPTELDENGIKNVFSKFGTVTGIIVADDSKFAFVSYGTYAETEAAIASLDRKPPLDLYVEFRKKKTIKNESVSVTQKDSEPVKVIERQDHRYNYSRFLRPLEARPGNFKLPPPEMSPYYYNYPKEYCVYPSMSEFFDNIAYPETNALWSRGKVTVDPAGQRHIALGRGYTYYHIPVPFPEVERQLNRVYEQRMPDSYVHGNDELSDQVGKCLACSKNAIYNCKSCGGSYCSTECQTADWPQHRTQCMIPSLIPTSIPTSPSGTPKKNGIDPKAVINGSKHINNEVIADNFKPIEKENINDEKKQIIANNSDSSVKLDGAFEKKKIDLASRLEISRKSVAQVNDKDFEFKKNENCFLSTVNFIQVQIVVVHKHGLLSVQKTSDIEKLMELMTKLTLMNEKFEKVKVPVVGKIYAAIYDGIWHRIILLDSIPTLKIDYIDYGTIEEATEPVELRDIGELANIPRFSRLIRIRSQYQEKYKNLKETDTINVRMIDVDNNGIVNVDIFDKVECTRVISTSSERPKKLIHIEVKPKPLKLSQAEFITKSVDKMDTRSKEIEQLNEKTELRSSIKQSEKNIINDFPNILDTLKKGVNQVVGEIIGRINNESVVVAILYDEVQDEYTQLMEPLKSDCENLKPQYIDFKPQVNDLVCGFKSDDSFWRRGRVLSISPTITIASLDEGVKCDVDAVIPVPPKYLKIPPFTIILTAKVDLSELNTVIFKVLEDKLFSSSHSNVFLRGESIENSDIKFEIRSWNPLAKPTVTIKDGSKVSIQSIRSSSIVCIRSLEDKEVERYHRVLQDTAKASLTALDFSTNPEIGDLVMAQFLDGNYYRAIVLEVENNPENPKIKINYVDFGNNEVTTLQKLKILPAQLKKEPYYAMKITLKGIKNGPPNEKAILYLESISDQETPYVLNFTDIIDNGVTLTNLQGTVVNDTVNEFLEPSWQKKEEAKDEDYLKLGNMDAGKLGKVGEVVQAYFLASIEPGFKYVFASIDAELITHISQVLPELLTEYCNKSEFYIPRNNELCIAKFENEWYRGCCIKPSLTPDSAEIFFLDYGNVGEVKHQDIRMMKDDFLKPSALGLVCNTLDFAKSKNSKELLEKLDTIFIPNEVYSLHILKYEDTEWTVEFPEVKQKLIKDGLLHS